MEFEAKGSWSTDFEPSTEVFNFQMKFLDFWGGRDSTRGPGVAVYDVTDPRVRSVGVPLPSFRFCFHPGTEICSIRLERFQNKNEKCQQSSIAPFHRSFNMSAIFASKNRRWRAFTFLRCVVVVLRTFASPAADALFHFSSFVASSPTPSRPRTKKRCNSSQPPGMPDSLDRSSDSKTKLPAPQNAPGYRGTSKRSCVLFSSSHLGSCVQSCRSI